MMRNWKMIDLAGLFAIALASGPALAGDESKDPPDLKTIKKQLDAMHAGLTKMDEKIGKDIGDLKKEVSVLTGDRLKQRIEYDELSAKIGTIEKHLAKLQLHLDTLKKKGPSDIGRSSDYPPVEKASLDEIKTRLGQIEQALAKRISFSPVPTGRIMFVNLYSDELLFSVNGRPYRVAPNTTLPLEGQVAGTFNYEVISRTYGLLKQTTSVISPNETVTITAR